MKKFNFSFTSIIGIIIVCGLFYFLYQVIVSGNVLQSIAASIIGGIIGTLAMSLMFGARDSEDKMYEVAIADLQKQLTEEQDNYNLMRQANQTLYNDKFLLEEDVKRQAKIISELADKLQIKDDAERARFARCSPISKVKIGENGKIIES